MRAYCVFAAVSEYVHELIKCRDASLSSRSGLSKAYRTNKIFVIVYCTCLIHFYWLLIEILMHYALLKHFLLGGHQGPGLYWQSVISGSGVYWQNVISGSGGGGGGVVLGKYDIEPYV